MALAGFGSYGAGQAIHSEPVTRFLTETMHARAEPPNALSAQTWAVHVSSVTEWAVAMRLVSEYAREDSRDAFSSQTDDANENWRFLSFAMTPFLASGLAAARSTPLQRPVRRALVRCRRSSRSATRCAVAAFSVYRNGVDMSGTRSENEKTFEEEEEETKENVRVDESGGGMTLSSIVSFASFVVLSSTACVATPTLAGDFFFEPSYDKALTMIAAPTLVWAAFLFAKKNENDVFDSDRTKTVANENEETKKSGFAQVKEFGTAGVASYVLVELLFWAVALPAAIAWYRVAEGTWLDLDDPADKAKLLGAGAVFINGVRFFVPFRLAAALALAPVVRRTFFDADAAPYDADADEASAEEDETPPRVTKK